MFANHSRTLIVNLSGHNCMERGIEVSTWLCLWSWSCFVMSIGT